MKNLKYYVLGLVVALAIGGAYFYPKYKQVAVTPGAVGDTQATPKMAQVQCDPATTTYISTDNKYQYCSITNSSATDRIISSIETDFTALNGTVSTSTPSKIQMFLATTSAASSGYGTNTNWLMNMGFGTSTPNAFVGSSTPGVSTTVGASDFVRIWAAGSVIVFEGTATTSAGGSAYLKVNYLQQ